MMSRAITFSLTALVLAVLLPPGQMFAAAPGAVFPWSPPDPGYKITVAQAGLYQLTYDTLSAAGVPVDSIDPRTFRMFNQGKEIAILVEGEDDGKFDPGDRILFFANIEETRYTNESVYWLGYNNSLGQRMTEKENRPDGAPISAYTTTQRYEVNQIYLPTLPTEAGHDHWFGPSIIAVGAGSPGTLTISITLDSVLSQEEPRLTGVLGGNIKGTHHIRIDVNGVQAYENSWQNRTLHAIDASIPAGTLHNGKNDIHVTLVNDTPGQNVDMVYLDWLAVRHHRQLVAQGNILMFNVDTPGAWQYRISGFSKDGLRIFDISNPNAVVAIPFLPFHNFLPTFLAGQNQETAAHQAPNATNQDEITFGDIITSSHQYLVVNPAGILQPTKIELDQPSNLQHEAQGADYLIITSQDFWPAAEQLAIYRANQGLRTQVIDVQDVYDEFNGGSMSSEAIHDFLAYTYNHWPTPAPQYVLLLGDGTYDMRHYLPDTRPTYIPPYLVYIDSLSREIASDNRYVTLTGGDILPEMHIGRMPVNNLDEANALVAKTITYETNPLPGEWQRNAIFVTDDLDEDDGFYDFADTLADGYDDPPANTIKYLPSSYTPIKIYAGQTCDQDNPPISVECKQPIVNSLETDGAVIMAYVGHGSPDFWAAEKLMDKPTIRSLQNQRKWPITLTFSCSDGYFHAPSMNDQSLAEANVLASGSSVASISSTNQGILPSLSSFSKGIFLALFNERLPTLGETLTAAKRYQYDHLPPNSRHFLEPIDTYILFGDPALRVPTNSG